MINWITGITRKSWKQLGRFRIQTKRSHEMHRRSKASSAEGISNPLESPVTYTESRNVIVVIIQWMVVDRCLTTFLDFLNYCLDEIRYLQRAPV